MNIIIKLTKRLILIKKWMIVTKNAMIIKPKKKLSISLVWFWVLIIWPYPIKEVIIKIEKIKKNIVSKIIV